jgi:hypothetical protein
LRQDQYLVNPPRHLKETLRQVVGANVDRPRNREQSQSDATLGTALAGLPEPKELTFLHPHGEPNR